VESLAAGGRIPSSMAVLSADLTRGCLGPVAGSIRVEAAKENHLHSHGGHLTVVARAGTEKGIRIIQHLADVSPSSV